MMQHYRAIVVALACFFLVTTHVTAFTLPLSPRSSYSGQESEMISIQGTAVSVEIVNKVFDVSTFGAVGNGEHDDTEAVHAAFVAAQKNGGGIVRFSGNNKRYLTRAFSFLSSNTAMEIQTGAAVAISCDIENWGKQVDAITGSKLQHLAMFGGGVVDGQGDTWWQHPHNFRPRLVYIDSSSDMVIRDLTFKNSPNHNLEMFVDNTEIYNVSIIAPYNSPNTDGIDVHGSPFYIHHSHISVGDDCVAVHNSDVLVEHCMLGTGHGASIGSIGGAEISNVTFRNLEMRGTVYGARIKAHGTARGYLRNVTYENIRMSHMWRAIQVDMDYRRMRLLSKGVEEEPSQELGHLKWGPLQVSNIVFKDITATHTEAGPFIDCNSRMKCKDFLIENVKIDQHEYYCHDVSGHSRGDNQPRPCF